MTALAREGVVPPEIAARLADAVRLWNILVHGYLDIDAGRIFDELGWIDDAATFGELVQRWLEARGL